MTDTLFLMQGQQRLVGEQLHIEDRIRIPRRRRGLFNQWIIPGHRDDKGIALQHLILKRWVREHTVDRCMHDGKVHLAGDQMLFLRLGGALEQVDGDARIERIVLRKNLWQDDRTEVMRDAEADMADLQVVDIRDFR